MERLVLAFVEAALGGRVGQRDAARAPVFQFAGDADAAFGGVDADLVAAFLLYTYDAAEQSTGCKYYGRPTQKKTK